MNDIEILLVWRQKLKEKSEYNQNFPTVQLREMVAQELSDKIMNLMETGSYDMRIMGGKQTALLRLDASNYPAVRANMVQELIAYKINSNRPLLEVVKIFHTKSNEQLHIHICPRNIEAF